MTILCATDLSASSDAATKLAAVMARRGGDSIVLLHVMEPFLDMARDQFVYTAEAARAVEQAARTQLEATAAALHAGGLAVEVQVLTGDPRQLILETARQLGARFIAVGTHGRRAAARFFLGSVAEHVARHAPCPVLVARAEMLEIKGWPERGRLHLAVALDGSAECDAAVAWVRSLRRTIPCDVTVIRIYSPPREAAHYGVATPWLGQKGHPSVDSFVQRDAERLVGGTLPGEGELRVRTLATTANPADDLASELTLLAPDAVVLGVADHRRLAPWPELALAPVLRSVPVPAICVPRELAPATGLPQFRTLLVATDLSDESRVAVLAAYGLLRGSGGAVELCHVHERGPEAPAADLRLASTLAPDARARIEERLRALIPAEAATLGIATRISVLEGRLAPEAIIEAADRFGADAIVLASHGRGGLARAVLGSVSDQVARHTTRPVVIVPVARA